MTNLTDKWKKGELPEGLYYFKLPNGEIMAGTDYCLATYLLTKDSNSCEVLGEVPSYREYLEMEGHCAAYSDTNQWQKEEISAYKRLVAEVEQENTKLKTENKWYSEQLNEAVKEVGHLKELLTMVKPVLQLEYNVTENRNLIKKINQLLGEE